MFTLSKITAPRINRAIERKTLFQALDTALQKRVLWVSAPGGSGKTTLVASYLKSRKCNFLWYHMDETDVDAATFFHYMELAIKKLHQAPHHRKKVAVPEFKKEYFKTIRTFTVRYFERLFSSLSRLSTPFVIVLDDYRDVAAGCPIHDIIARGISLMPEGIKAVITSRGEPPPEFASLRINQDVSYMGMDELAFTTGETFELIKISTKHAVEESAARALCEKTGGWAAGLVMAIETGGMADTIPFYEGLDNTDVIFDYFAREIFERNELEVRQFLLKTSYLPQFSLHMAEELAGPVLPAKILWLNKHRFFLTSKLAERAYTFQYNALFRKFLRARAKDCFKEDEHEIISRAADILEENGYVEDSAELCIESRNWEKLKSIILNNAQTMIDHGRSGTLEKWFTALPYGFIECLPWLLYYKGMHGLSANPQEARNTLEGAYGQFKSLDDVEGMLSTFCAIVDTFVYEWKDFHPLDYWLDEFDELARRLMRRQAKGNTLAIDDRAVIGASPCNEVLRQRLVASVFSAFLFRRPNHTDMPYWEEESLKILHLNDANRESLSNNRLQSASISASISASQLMSLGHNLILYYLWTGRIPKAGAVVETLSAIVEKAKKASSERASSEPILARLMFLRSKSLYMTYTASHKEALKVVEEGLNLAEESGVHMVDLMLLVIGIYNCLPLGDNETAEAYLGKMVSFVDNTKYFCRMYYYRMASLLALSRGDYLAAVEHAEISLQLTVESGATLIIGTYEYSIAYILAEAGRLAEARSHIDKCIRIGTDTGSGLFVHLCSILEALIALYEKNDGLFVEKITGAAVTGKATGMRFTAFLRSSTERLCKAAVDMKIAPDYIKEIIRLNTLTPGSHLYEDWPYPLKIYTLGKFELERDGTAVNFQAGTQRKQTEMLTALIALGGKDVDVTQLSDTLWPDTEGDLATAVFRTTLHRLRKSLIKFSGIDKDVIVMSDGRISLNENYCWTDLWALQDIVDEFQRALYDVEKGNGRGRAAKERGASRKLVKPKEAEGITPLRGVVWTVPGLYEKAINIYKGEFLPDIRDNQHSAYLREHLKDKIIRLCCKTGEFWESIKQWNKGIECYKTAARIDNLREESYRYMMACYIKAGLPEKAIAVYNAFKGNFHRVFGIPPSGEIEAIYRSLIKKDNVLSKLSASTQAVS
ncbi:MAG: hypothetical protein HQK94_17780 [Nitrospirae bacterium]|nr:hypothetical protein [Nitrospirota bacterium]